MTPLGLLTSGEQGEIMEIREQKQCQSCHCNRKGYRNEQSRIEDMGIRVGKKVEMLNNEMSGLVLLKVDEARIAVSRSLAMRILIRRN